MHYVKGKQHGKDFRRIFVRESDGAWDWIGEHLPNQASENGTPKSDSQRQTNYVEYARREEVASRFGKAGEGFRF